VAFFKPGAVLSAFCESLVKADGLGATLKVSPLRFQTMPQVDWPERPWQRRLNWKKIVRNL
jgi:hypothetical protein